MIVAENATTASGTDPVRALVGRGTLYSIATVLQLSVAIVVLPALTRLLTADAYGVVAVAVIVQLALALLGAAGLPDTLARTYFRTEDGPVRAASLVALVMGTAFVVALAADLTGAYWSPTLVGLHYGGAVRIAVWSSIAVAVLLTAQALLRAADRAAAFLVTAILATAVTQLVALAVVVVWSRTSTGFFAGVAAGMTTAAVVAVALSGVALRPLYDVRFVRTTLALSVPVVLNGLSLYLIWAGNRAVVNRLEGATAAGRFQVAFLIGGLIVLFISAVYTAWSPIVLGAPDERRWQTLTETTRAVYSVSCVGAAAIAVGAPAALLVLAPSAYRPLDLVDVTATVTVSAIPFAAYCVSLLIILWHGRTVPLAVVTAFIAVVNVALNLALVEAFGLEGAAAATVISYVLQALLLHVVARKLVRVPSTRRPLVVALALTVAAATAAIVVPSEGAWLALHVAAALALLAWLARTAFRLHATASA